MIGGDNSPIDGNYILYDSMSFGADSGRPTFNFLYHNVPVISITFNEKYRPDVTYSVCNLSGRMEYQGKLTDNEAPMKIIEKSKNASEVLKDSCFIASRITAAEARLRLSVSAELMGLGIAPTADRVNLVIDGLPDEEKYKLIAHFAK